MFGGMNDIFRKKDPKSMGLSEEEIGAIIDKRLEALTASYGVIMDEKFSSQ